MKIMNKINIYIVLLLLVVSSLISCEDQLEIEPRQSLSDKAVFTTFSGLQNAVNGAYDGLQESNTFGADIVQCAELWTPMVSWTGSFISYSDLSARSMQATNTEASSFWIDAYDAINRANKVKAAIDGGKITDPQFDSDAKNKFLGSAYFIRALVHFELCRFFAQPFNAGAKNPGIIIVTEPTDNVDNAVATIKPRATVEEVYKQVIADLKKAEKLLPDSWDGYATKWSTKALLSRVYMTMKDWTNAAATAKEVIDSKKFKLLDNVNTFYKTDNSAEEIFAIQNTATDNHSGDNDALVNYWSPLQRAEIQVTKKAMDMYESADKRNEWFFYSDSKKSHFSSKYQNKEWNLVLIKYSEMLLNRAESLANLIKNDGDVDAEAIGFVNEVRKRAGISAIAPTTKSALLASIKDEVIREFMHEGHLYHDYKRWEEPSIEPSSGVKTFAWNASKNIFPIPQREIDVFNVDSEILKQNKDY